MGSSKKIRSKKRVLFSKFETPEETNQSALKDLYGFLVKLSASALWNAKCAECCHEFDFEISYDGIKLTFGDICGLSDVLFEKLEERFELLFLKLSGVSAAEDLGGSSSSLDLFDAVEVLNLLFRCCMLLLVLLAVLPNLIFAKGLVLLRIIRKLMLPDFVKKTEKHAFVFEKSVFRECAPQDNGCSASSVEGFSASIEFLGPCNPLLFLKSTMLEVFVDELLAHRQLTVCFKIVQKFPSINTDAPICDVPFKSRSAQGDSGMLMEAICNHFILSFSDKQVFGDFFSRLFCTHAMKLDYPYRRPVLGISAAVSLFLNPIMVSAPKYMQAHLFSLVSEAVNIKNFKPDRKLMNCFLSTFEKSVILYMRHMSRWQTDGCSIFHVGSSSSSSHDGVHPQHEFYISPQTKDKVDTLISRLDSSSIEVLDSNFSRMKSDMVSTALRFVKDFQNACAAPSNEEIFTILSSLVLKASESYTDTGIQPIDGTTLQHLYLCTSLLKLMSISLLQAIWCVRHNDDLSCLRTLKEFSSCKEYDFIMDTVSCFKDLDVSLPLQQVLYRLISSHSTKHMTSKAMFLHFSGLMSLSFATGFDCLVKACLLIIVALLNLFLFEEGNLDALHSLVDSKGGSFSSELQLVRFQETVVDQSSSLVVASKFHKMRSLHLRVMEKNHIENESLCSQTLASASRMGATTCLEEETEETCNGEIYLNCMLQQKVPDFDDLADFIECQQGKDYSSWLKNRQRFRKWRHEKMAILKWKRRKKSWKFFKGRRND